MPPDSGWNAPPYTAGNVSAHQRSMSVNATATNVSWSRGGLPSPTSTTSSIGISTASSGSTIGGRSGSSTGTVVEVAASPVGDDVGSEGSLGPVGSVGSTLDASVGGVV